VILDSAVSSQYNRVTDRRETTNDFAMQLQRSA